jgi:hypothetical protein
MAIRLTGHQLERLQRVADLYNGRKHVLYALQRHHLRWHEMLKSHELEKDMFLADIKPSKGMFGGVEFPGGGPTYKTRGREYAPDAKTTMHPRTGKIVRMPTREPGNRVGVNRRIASLLLTLIELGPGHLGDCERKECGKTFVKQRVTARFCSACRGKSRSPRGDYMKEKMKEYRKEPRLGHWTSEESATQLARA